MRALSPARSAHSHVARSRAGIWVATELLLIVLATALALALHAVLPRSWSAWDTVPPQAVGLALVVGGLVLLLTRGLASAQRREQGEPDPADRAAGDPPGADEPTPPDPDPAQLRTLQAHVRSLEQALELETHRVAELRALLESGQPDSGHPESAGEDLHRVRATVRGLARRTAGDAVATEVLARVEAALERLSAPSAFARPVLTRAGTTTIGTVPSPGELLMHDHHPEPGRGTAAAEVPTGSAPTGPLEDEPEGLELLGPHHAADDHHPGAGAPEREVVLPVPPREVPEASSGQRGRRWFRRHAA